MHLLKIIAWIVIAVYFLVALLLYVFQTKLIFYPGVLAPDFKFSPDFSPREIFIDTADGARINALFFKNTRRDVILYFHGNAGDLSGWQFVAEDFLPSGYNFLIIDYRGYGKSRGTLSEKGLYQDAQAAYDYLTAQGFAPGQILIYGRSIGSGVAVDLASKNLCQGLVLESPFSSFGKLANEKFPMFFPALYLRFRFDNIRKINDVKSPIIFLHGADDDLIPSSHSSGLFEKFKGRKKLIIVPHGAHNDLHAFREYREFLIGFPSFFNGH